MCSCCKVVLAVVTAAAMCRQYVQAVCVRVCACVLAVHNTHSCNLASQVDVVFSRQVTLRPAVSDNIATAHMNGKAQSIKYPRLALHPAPPRARQRIIVTRKATSKRWLRSRGVPKPNNMAAGQGVVLLLL